MRGLDGHAPGRQVTSAGGGVGGGWSVGQWLQRGVSREGADAEACCNRGTLHAVDGHTPACRQVTSAGGKGGVG